MNLLHIIEVPARIVSEANNFDHWTKKHKRKKELQLLIRNSFKNISIPLPVTIKLIRQATTAHYLDYVNLVHSMKYAQDCIADIIIPNLRPGFADSDKRISWLFDQQKGKNYALIVEIYF
jgi:hypothetical protein